MKEYVNSSTSTNNSSGVVKRECHNHLKKTLETVIQEFKENNPEEADLYDFSKSVYISSSTKMLVHCKKHNVDFWVTPHHFIKGIKSCPECKREIVERKALEEQERTRSELTDFLEKWYSDYNFDIDEYCGTHEPFTLIHKVTGKKKITTLSKLRREVKIRKGLTVPKGTYKEFFRKSEEDRLIKALNDYDPSIDTSHVHYTGSRKMVTIYCKDHPNIPQYIMPCNAYERVKHGRNFCKYCAQEIKYKEMTKNFIDRYNKLYPNHNLDFSKTIFMGFRHHITVRCKEHDLVFTVFPSTIMEGGLGCPVCCEQKKIEGCRNKHQEYLKKKEAEFFNFMQVNYPDIDTSITDFVDLYVPVKFRCKKDNEVFERTPWRIIYLDAGKLICPECKKHELKGISLLEKVVINTLEHYNIKFNREVYNYDNEILNKIPDSKFVRVDFTFSNQDKLYWIEANGPQHYEFTPFLQDTEDRFVKQVIRDKSIREYCKNHDIVLIEIPYTYSLEDTKKAIFDIVFDDKSPEDIIVSPKIKYPENYKEEQYETK